MLLLLLLLAAAAIFKMKEVHLPTYSLSQASKKFSIFKKISGVFGPFMGGPLHPAFTFFGACDTYPTPPPSPF
jgi:hypothetical protein